MTMKQRILAALRSLGSGTYKDIVTFLQMTKSKPVLKRMKELVDAGLIVKQGERRQTGAKRTSAIYNLSSVVKTDAQMKDKVKKRFRAKSVLPREDNFYQPEMFD